MARSQYIRLALWSFVSIAMSACLEPYLPHVSKEDYGILVVDGFFVPNDTTEIRLTRSATVDNPTSSKDEPVALVEIEDDQSHSYRLTSKGDGLYTLPPVTVNEQGTYRLHVHRGDGNDFYSDYLSLSSSHQLDSITWTEEEITDDIIGFDLFAHDATNSTHYYLWSYEETWQYTSIDVSKYEFVNGKVIQRKDAAELFTCWNTLKDQNYFLASTIALSRDLVYRYRLLSLPQRSHKLYSGYSILVKQFALTEEAHRYFTIIKENSEKIGTLSDPIPSQPKSNIQCVTDPTRPAVGYFQATTVQHRRVLIKRQQIKGPRTPYDPSGFENCGLGEVLPPEKITEEYMDTRMIFDIIYDRVTQEFLGYAVFPKACLDCRTKGGILKKPEYWGD